MKESFEKYREYLIEETKKDIRKNAIESTFTGQKIKGWKKKYESSEEFAKILSDIFEKSRKIKKLKNATEDSSWYKYFIENEEVIIYLIDNNQEINNLNIENYCVNKSVSEADFSSISNKFETYKQTVFKRFIKYFSSERIGFTEEYYDEFYYNGQYPKKRTLYLSVGNVEQFLESFELCKFSYSFFVGCSYCGTYFKDYYRKNVNKLIPKTLQKPREIKNFTYAIWNRFIDELNYADILVAELCKKFTLTYIFDLISQNKNYSNIYESLYQKALSYSTLQDDILNSIPENYAEMYPETRKLKRHFVLHIGPTNSGKTYFAIQRLIECKTGVYLAPLRLLAYEQFENLNKQGCPCNLLTGEESVNIQNANKVSSTIEMLDTTKEYEVAIIDEGQMLADSNRGQAWTAAIVAVKAKEVHVCASTNAKDILIKLINDCGDTYGLHKTDRQVPIKYDVSFHKLPEDVKDGDALIVFSRKDVHAVASVLRSNGIKCSTFNS